MLTSFSRVGGTSASYGGRSKRAVTIYKVCSVGEWRNGSRAGLRNQWSNPWRFESSLAHSVCFVEFNEL